MTRASLPIIYQQHSRGADTSCIVGWTVCDALLILEIKVSRWHASRQQSLDSSKEKAVQLYPQQLPPVFLRTISAAAFRGSPVQPLAGVCRDASHVLSCWSAEVYRRYVRDRLSLRLKLSRATKRMTTSIQGVVCR